MSTPMRIEGTPPRISDHELKELEQKVKLHNDTDPENFITMIEKEGYVTLEGPLRVHWGITIPLRFKEDDSHDAQPWRKNKLSRKISKTMSMCEDTRFAYEERQTNEALTSAELSAAEDPFSSLKASGVPAHITPQEMLAVKMRRGKFHTIKENKVKRRCSINGHFYLSETSSNFTPAFGSDARVFVGSHLKTSEVIKRLLDKFKIENSPSELSLYIVKQNGEMWPLKDSDHPLMEKINLNDTGARIFLMDRPDQSVNFSPKENDSHDATRLIAEVWKPVEEPTICEEASDYIYLPDPMLHGFLLMLEREQDKCITAVQQRYANLKDSIKTLLREKRDEETFL